MTTKDTLRFEYPDPTPVELPVTEGRFPNTLAELEAQQRHRAHLAMQLMEETFEEADDFDVDDDRPDPTTPWEIAADATQLTPDQLFMEVYGISREEAHAKLADLARQGKPDGVPLIDKQSSDDGEPKT